MPDTSTWPRTLGTLQSGGRRIAGSYRGGQRRYGHTSQKLSSVHTLSRVGSAHAIYFNPNCSLVAAQSRLRARNAWTSAQRRNGFVARSSAMVELGRTP